MATKLEMRAFCSSVCVCAFVSVFFFIVQANWYVHLTGDENCALREVGKIYR